MWSTFRHGRHGYDGSDGYSWLRKETEAEAVRPKTLREEQARGGAGSLHASRIRIDIRFVQTAPVPTPPIASERSVDGSSFSKKQLESLQEQEFDPDEVGPPPPPGASVDGQEEPEFEPSDSEDDAPEFPTTHELLLKDHTKVVSALALDPSGARVISGSQDYDCKLWDFGGMDWRCKPFKTWEPAGTYFVRSSSFTFQASC